MTTAFVFGGGGRWGAVEVGMLRALHVAGITPDLVLGTSIGVFNGSVISDRFGADGVESLTALWVEIASTGILQGRQDRQVEERGRDEAGFARDLGAEASARAGHSAGRLNRGSEAPVPVCGRLHRARRRALVHQRPAHRALLASSAVPALFPPIEIAGEHFYDGGLVNSVPLARVVELGAREIYVLQVGRIESQLRPPSGCTKPR